MEQLTPWERIELIRHKGRPTINDYIPLIFDEFYELHGDRCFGDDAAILGGIGPVSYTHLDVYKRQIWILTVSVSSWEAASAV